MKPFYFQGLIMALFFSFVLSSCASAKSDGRISTEYFTGSLVSDGAYIEKDLSKLVMPDATAVVSGTMEDIEAFHGGDPLVHYLGETGELLKSSSRELVFFAHSDGLYIILDGNFRENLVANVEDMDWDKKESEFPWYNRPGSTVEVAFLDPELVFIGTDGLDLLVERAKNREQSYLPELIRQSMNESTLTYYKTRIDLQGQRQDLLPEYYVITLYKDRDSHFRLKGTFEFAEPVNANTFFTILQFNSDSGLYHNYLLNGGFNLPVLESQGLRVSMQSESSQLSSFSYFVEMIKLSIISLSYIEG